MEEHTQTFEDKLALLLEAAGKRRNVLENREILEDLIISQDVKEFYEVFELCLKGQEKTVIGLRYGLFGKQPRTQREIADMLGISRSYVSRIEKKAVEKLREKFGTD